MNETKAMRPQEEAGGADEEPRGVVFCSSPPCSMHELDDVSLGYMEGTEVVGLLNQLLEAERAGARAVGFMSRQGADERRDALRQVAADEAAFCAMLARHVTRCGGTPSRVTGTFYEKVLALESDSQRLKLLDRGQSWVVRKLREALPRIRDDRLHEDLRDMLEVHEHNIERCARLME
jgi:hypothetical protein